MLCINARSSAHNVELKVKDAMLLSDQLYILNRRGHNISPCRTSSLVITELYVVKT